MSLVTKTLPAPVATELMAPIGSGSPAGRDHDQRFVKCAGSNSAFTKPVCAASPWNVVQSGNSAGGGGGGGGPGSVGGELPQPMRAASKARRAAERDMTK